MDIEQKIGFISTIFENVHNMISFADAKANISLSIQSILISIGLGTTVLTDAFDKVKKYGDIKLEYIFYLIVILFIIVSFCGIISAILVYISRVKSKQKRGLVFFGHIIKYPTADKYIKEISNIDENRVVEEYGRQIFILSYIANKKMKYVNWSIFFLVINLVLITILLLLSGHINTLQISEV